MSFYEEEGANIRAILDAKIENVFESEVDRDMILRFIPFVRLLKEISTTLTGEEGKELNVLYMTASSIYSVYYAFMISTSAGRQQSKDNPENLKSIDEFAKKFLDAMNEISKTFLTKLKEIISTDGSKDLATELYENTYDSIVKKVLHKYTM